MERPARPTSSRSTWPRSRAASSSERPIASEAPSRRAALAGAAAVLAGCSRHLGDGVSFWAMDTPGENARYILPAFQRATGTPVELQWLSWTAAHQKLLTAYAGRRLPDLTMLSSAWTAEFARIGAVTSLPRGAASLAQGALAGAAGLGRATEGQVAVPWVIDTQVQYWRRDLLAAAGYAEPPQRWSEWKAMLHAVKRRSAGGYAILMQLNWPEHLFTILAQQPEPLLRERQGRGNFRAPAVKAALAFYKSLFDEGLAPVVTSIEAGDPVAELARGWVAVHPSGSWILAELRRRPRELPPSLWATSALPGPQGAGAGVVAGAMLAVTRDAADPARALRLAGYLLDPATQVRFHRLCGVLPSRAAAWRDTALAGDPAVAAFAAQLSRPRAMPDVLEWSRIVDETQLVAERMVRGDLGVDAAAAAMDATADRILAKRRWLLDRGQIA